MAASFCVADTAAARFAAAPREGAGRAALYAQPSAIEAVEDAADDSGARDEGGLELRASVLGGAFEGPLYGVEASAAFFNPLQEDQPLQVGFEAQVRHARDTEPEGTLEDAALTAFTGNLVARGSLGRLRPYAGVGAGFELYHYDSTFTDRSGTISGFVYQGFAGTTIDINESMFLDLRVTVSDRDYEETTSQDRGFFTRTETIYARDVSLTATFGIGIRF